MNDHGPIHVCTVVLRDEAGAVLTVRKRGTDYFMLPGGKPEPGESPRQPAARECLEELCVRLDPAALRLLGVFRGRAANERDREVRSTVFIHPRVIIGDRRPRSPSCAGSTWPARNCRTTWPRCWRARSFRPCCPNSYLENPGRTAELHPGS